jgi:hypothetical protein
VAAFAALSAAPAATATAKPLRNSIGISGTWGAGPTRSVFVRDSDYELWALDQTGTTNTWTDLQAKTRTEDILGTVVSAVLAKDNSHTDSFFVDTWTELPPVPMDGFSPFTRIDYGAGLGSIYVVSTTGRLIEYVPTANQWVNREFPNLAYSYTGYVFDVNDSRGYGGDGDWAVGDLKGECAANEWMTGVSTGGMSAPTHSVQCTSTDTASSFTSGGHTLTISADNDGYGSHNVGDWDYGYFKGECAANEIVTGLSQSGGALNHVRCSGAARAIASNCHALAIPTSDNRESPRNNNDWAVGYLKAECANGSAIAGVSRDVSTGATHAVLCCDFLAF